MCSLWAMLKSWYDKFFGSTTLIRAISAKDAMLVKRFIDAGADVNKADSMNNIPCSIDAVCNHTPLVHAVWTKDTQIVKLLIDAGADLNNTDSMDHTPLFHAVCTEDTQIVKLLIDAGANVNKACDTTPLVHAVLTKDTQIVKLLIDAGADVNKTDWHGTTPLLHAIIEKDEEILKLLIKAGADVTKVDSSGLTPLLHAIIKKDVEIVKTLIKSGVDLNKIDRNGITPWIIASRAGDGEIITAIENFKTAYPTIIAIQENKMSAWVITRESAQEKTEAGYTVLMAAYASGNIALVEKLLEYGADIYACDIYGRTALSYARSADSIMSFIKNNKLDIPKLDISSALGSVDSAYSILRRAVKENNKELIQLILQHVSEIVEHDNSLLSLSEDITVIRLLSRYGISPPRNIVLQPHIQQEVIVHQILASTPWSRAQRLTMSVGDVKEWMRDYADMTSLIDQKTMKEIQACEDDTRKATELLADDRLLYTVYCAKVVRKIREGEMSLSTMTLASLIESKMYLEHGYAKQALDRLLGTSEVIDVHIASHRIELEHAMQPLLMIPYESSYDERLLKFLKLFMQDSITTDSKKSGDYQVLLELTDKIITETGDDLDKSIKELIAKAQTFGEDKEGVESVFAACLVKWTENWSMKNHVVLSCVGIFSERNISKDSGLNTPNTEKDGPHL